MAKTQTETAEKIDPEKNINAFLARHRLDSETPDKYGAASIYTQDLPNEVYKSDGELSRLYATNIVDFYNAEDPLQTPIGRRLKIKSGQLEKWLSEQTIDKITETSFGKGLSDEIKQVLKTTYADKTFGDVKKNVQEYEAKKKGIEAKYQEKQVGVEEKDKLEKLSNEFSEELKNLKDKYKTDLEFNEDLGRMIEALAATKTRDSTLYMKHVKGFSLKKISELANAA
jgi:hypothetical protein